MNLIDSFCCSWEKNIWIHHTFEQWYSSLFNFVLLINILENLLFVQNLSNIYFFKWNVHLSDITLVHLPIYMYLLLMKRTTITLMQFVVFRHRLLDSIIWNSTELSIIHYHAEAALRFQTLLLDGIITKRIWCNYTRSTNAYILYY